MEEKPSQQHRIYLNQLQNESKIEQHKTQETLEILLKSVQNRITRERTLTENLENTQIALAKSQEEVKTLLASQSLFDSSMLIKKKVAKETTKNKTLKMAQYHASLAEASLQIKQLKGKLQRKRSESALKTERTAAELRVLRSRVEQLQKTVRNVNLLRKKEKEKYEGHLATIRKEIGEMKTSQRKARETQLKYKSMVTQASKDRDALIKKMEGKDVLLQESRHLLSQEKGFNAALRKQMETLMIENDSVVAKQTEEFHDTMLLEHAFRNKTKDMFRRLSLLNNEQVLFIEQVAGMTNAQDSVL